MTDTLLNLADRLPLTCSRLGTCCHGKAIWVNPWENAVLAHAAQRSIPDFIHSFTCDGGVRLAMGGTLGWRQLPACSLYDPASGCTVHRGRPLACRLYPLGRMRQRDSVRYLHEGRRFPCLDGCPDVVNLPELTVADYLAGQHVHAGELAQDAYLDFMQDLADGALVLLLDSGLAASHEQRTLARWQFLATLSPHERANQIPPLWRERLMIGGEPLSPEADPRPWITAHRQAMQQAAQDTFSGLDSLPQLDDASCVMMAMALQLGRALNIEPSMLAKRWIDTAIRHGATL